SADTYFVYRSPATPDRHSFPTRRSSDLYRGGRLHRLTPRGQAAGSGTGGRLPRPARRFLRPRNQATQPRRRLAPPPLPTRRRGRSEEHTSELQSRSDLVCRLLLEKKNK